MRKIIALLILSTLTLFAKAQQAYTLPHTTANCGGFVVDSAVADQKLVGKTLIYGNISHCNDKETGAGSVVEILNKSSKIIDTCYADMYGNYK